MQHLYALCFALFLLQSCSPIMSVVRVDPAGDAVISSFRYGNPVQTFEDNNIAVEANFYDASGEFLVFDVQVINDSDTDILFDPNTSAVISSAGSYAPAIDPEFQLLAIDRLALKHRRNRRAANIVGVSALVGAAVFAAVDGGAVAGGSAQDATALDSYLYAAQITGPIVDMASFTLLSDINSGDPRVGYQIQGEGIPTPQSRFFWLDYSFRKTTIQPGERAYGKLAFPRSDASRSLKLLVKVAGKEYTFNYDQSLYRR